MIAYSSVLYHFDHELFARRVKEARKAAGISQREASQMVGAESVVGLYENPRPDSLPTMRYFIEVCNLFDLNPVDFFYMK